MPEKPERNVEAPEKPDRPSGNVALPPIDAEPEEIVQALFQRPPKAITGHASDRRKTGEKK